MATLTEKIEKMRDDMIALRWDMVDARDSGDTATPSAIRGLLAELDEFQYEAELHHDMT